LEKEIFKNNKLGIYKYNIATGTDKTDIKDYKKIDNLNEENSILDLGSSYILSEFSKSNFLCNLLKKILPDSFN
jgi:hypothetical protein